ncbi:MFS transporter [Advenella kashmirensis W13003]|uniref:MFS transporter n=1 Tax=Advenella kashmirensis W13003 TaxID=1424334 RepID=V8QWB9_9BURK|nr:tripartite tricarboxylate transporter substrate binding protein [Advenella kashmirensis]ETF03947.1 MFS transporter [Advenella kashmirensis W13003]
MQITRRAALLLLAGALPAARALAADFFDGPVTIVAPFSPGGTADVLARSIGKELSEKYGQPFVVENRPGMGGNIGARTVATARPDGKTLLLGTIGIHSAYSVYKNLPYDPVKDLQPISILGAVPCTVVVNPNLPFKTFKELLDYARANPGKLNFGSAGTGSSTHMVGELLQQATGVKFTHVPYKGSSMAMTDLMGGQIDLMTELATTSIPIIKSGKIRALAVTSKERSEELPDLPTVSELGYPGFDGTGWFTIATGSGVPENIVQRLNQDINEILHAENMKQTWKGQALAIIGGSEADARKFVSEETIKWKKVINVAGIHAQ